MATQAGKLARKQEQAIAALLNYETIAAAATAAGIAERTLLMWLRKPGFQSAYRLARRQIVEMAIGNLQAINGAAVQTLRRNLTCGAHAVEVRAALGLLEHSLRAVEVSDLAQEVEDLKRQIEEMTRASTTTSPQSASPEGASRQSSSRGAGSQPFASTPGRSDAPDESDGLGGGPLAEEGPDLDQPPPPAALFPRSG